MSDATLDPARCSAVLDAAHLGDIQGALGSISANDTALLWTPLLMGWKAVQAAIGG